MLYGADHGGTTLRGAFGRRNVGDSGKNSNFALAAIQGLHETKNRVYSCLTSAGLYRRRLRLCPERYSQATTHTIQ